MSKTYARNPKVAKFTINLSEQVNSRLEAVADDAGMNKSTMAAQAIAIGVNLLEYVFLKSKAMDTVNTAAVVQSATQQLASDLMVAGEK